MVIVGSTNTDGTGSATNLNSENGQVFTNNEYPYIYNYETEDLALYWNAEGVNQGHDTISVEVTGDWNTPGLKEILITGGYQTIVTSGFVDVCIRNTANFLLNTSSTIYVIGAKRGYIDAPTSSGTPCDIKIYPHSNGASWSNLFEINATIGDDNVLFSSEQTDGTIDYSTKWTEFTVSLSSGNDNFYYYLIEAATESQMRYVNGGEIQDLIDYLGENVPDSLYETKDFDTLYLNRDTEDLDFINFEHISSDNNSIYLDSSLLQNNASADNGLILTNTLANFSEQIESVSVNELSQEQSDYLVVHELDSNDYYQVTVNIGNETYLLLMNEVDDLIAG